MRRQIIILVVAIFAFALNGIASDGIRRPPTIDTCDLCPVPGSVSCEIAPAACAQCWEECGEIPGTVGRRRPSRPYNDPTVDYRLPRMMAVIQAYFDSFYERRIMAHWTTKELLDDLADHNIRAAKMWLVGNPFDGSGRWGWTTPWGEEMCCMGGDYVVAENMDTVWMHPKIDLFIVRFISEAWSIRQEGCSGQLGGVVFANEPTYEIAKGFFERFGWMDKIIIFEDLENDWGVSGTYCRGRDENGYWLYPWADADPWWREGCIDDLVDWGIDEFEAYHACGDDLLRTRAVWVKAAMERRHRGVARARAEFPNAKLRIRTAAIINHGPWNRNEDDPEKPLVAGMFSNMVWQPDYAVISFWSKTWPITDALDWVQEMTGYPPYRIFVDELGSTKDSEQYEHILSRANAARCWGVDLVAIWFWRQTWCSDRQHGLFEQLQPCAGKVEFGGPRPGYWALRKLIDEPFDHAACDQSPKGG